MAFGDPHDKEVTKTEAGIPCGIETISGSIKQYLLFSSLLVYLVD